MNALVHYDPAVQHAAGLSLLEVEASYTVGVSPLENPQARLEAERAYQEIARIVRDEIGAQLPGRIRQLRVSASEKFVILSGACSSFHTKQLAQHVAMELLDGQRLINDITVFPPK